MLMCVCIFRHLLVRRVKIGYEQQHTHTHTKNNTVFVGRVASSSSSRCERIACPSQTVGVLCMIFTVAQRTYSIRGREQQITHSLTRSPYVRTYTKIGLEARSRKTLTNARAFFPIHTHTSHTHTHTEYICCTCNRPRMSMSSEHKQRVRA